MRFVLRYDSFNILYFIKKALNADHPIKFDVRKDNTYVCSLDLSSAHLAKTTCDLAQCRQGKKAFDIQYPSSLLCPSDDHGSLVLGIFDGDGSFSRTTNNRLEFNITSSSKQFLLGVQTSINKSIPSLISSGSVQEYGSNTSYYHLRYHTTDDVAAIGDWMYSSLPKDWIDGKHQDIDSPISKLMVPYHRKKYLRHQWLQQVKHEIPTVRAKAMESLVSQEKKSDEDILLMLQKMSLGLEFNAYGFHFRKRFIEHAEHIL